MQCLGTIACFFIYSYLQQTSGTFWKKKQPCGDPKGNCGGGRGSQNKYCWTHLNNNFTCELWIAKTEVHTKLQENFSKYQINNVYQALINPPCSM